MFGDTMLQINTENVKWIVSTLLTIVGVVIALFKMWQVWKVKLEDKLQHKVDDIYVDKQVKVVVDKMETYEAYNKRAHADMKADMTMAETRSNKTHDDLKEIFEIGNAAVNKRLDDIINLLKKQ